MPPPDLREIAAHIQGDVPRFVNLFTTYSNQSKSQLTYLSWDEIRYRSPPSGLDHKEWWFIIRTLRDAAMRETSLIDTSGRSFKYALPDEVLRLSEEITKNTSGQIGMSEPVTNPETRDRYLVSSLIEEAITSSQLEGASTEQDVAKEMIRTGRKPETISERMIVNNYAAMKRVGELRNEALTPEIICEIQRIVTDGTLENPDASGRFQLAAEERIRVRDEQDRILHTPPPAADLPERMERLCVFANGSTGPGYLSPVLRAITLHFMLGYEHPFEDGNGRTARALFYWSMLNQGFWLTEFLTVSKILKKAPAKYARSFLYTEQDSNDLTYFHIYHLDVLQRAVAELQRYLTGKMREVRDFQRSLATLPGEFNHRQLALLENAVKNTGQSYTAVSHATSHGVSGETARKDLTHLEERGLLGRTKIGKRFSWVPADNLVERLKGG